MLRTWLTERFGIEVPVVSAPMGGVADGRFAAAVCAAGGLGMVSIGDETAAWVRAQAALAAEPGRAYGIGLLAWLLPDLSDQLDAIREIAPPLVSLSYGAYEPFVAPLREAGIVVATQVGTPEEARHAVDAGVDVVVARGSEGGGHGRDAVSTLVLLQAVLDAVDHPVLAAGGIATSRGLAAVLAAGAAGAWVGTPFLACPEAAWPQARKDRVLAAGCEDTVYTRVFDIGLGAAWPVRFGGRAVRNTFSETWHGREDELSREPGLNATHLAAYEASDFDTAAAWAGQSAGLVNVERSVADVVNDLASAEELLRHWDRSRDAGNPANHHVTPRPRDR